MTEFTASSSASAGTGTYLSGANKDKITEAEPDVEKGPHAGDGENVDMGAGQQAAGGDNMEAGAAQQPQEGAVQQAAPISRQASISYSALLFHVLCCPAGGDNMEAGAAQQPQEGAVQQAAPISSSVNETSLHRAVWRRAPRGEFEDLRRHHDAGLTFHPNIDGMPPLYLAVYLGYSDTVTNLMETFGDLLSCDGPHGQNVLHVAALRSADLTQKVLGRRESGLELEINKHDIHGNTSLHYAASVGVKGVTSLLVAADANMKSTGDGNRMCPIHIAASVGAMDAIRSLLFSASDQDENCASATLLDANRGTFLHVAVKDRQTDVVKFVCRDKRFRNIFSEKEGFRNFLNTKDMDGNTALHLAVQNRDESNFIHLVGNRYVELNHVNEDGYTPLDLASKIKMQSSFASLQNPTEWMIRVLAHSGAQFSARRRDWRFKTPENAQEHPSQVTEGSSGAPQSAEQKRPPATQSVSGTPQKKQADLAPSTESVLVASALIATVTFAAAFTVPGSYKLDGNPKAGTPALGIKYGFKVFLVADVLAFFCSVVATFSLAAYGTQWNVDPLVRRMYARRAVWFFHVALKSVIVAFALGVSVVMWDISVATTIIVGAAALASVLYGNEALAHDLRLIKVMWRRFGLSGSWNLHPSTSSHLDWNTWRRTSFMATVISNVIDLFWTYILIYLLACFAQLKLKAGHIHL